MKEFKQSEEYKKILLDLKSNGYLNRGFDFVCKTDHYLLFNSTDKSRKSFDRVNICITTSSDVWCDFTGAKLVECENIEYLHYEFCEKLPEDEDWEIVESITFSCHE